MDYAQDRLDRRAVADAAAAEKHYVPDKEEDDPKDETWHVKEQGSTVAMKDPKTTTATTAAAGPPKSARRDGLQGDLRRAHGRMEGCRRRVVAGEEEVASILHELQKGHALAGRSLRDCGNGRQAIYHYAMAWMCCHDCASCAGDYAQMTEFGGFPEVGILALLYYRAGGTLSVQVPLEQLGQASLSPQDKDDQSCGCGQSGCHKAALRCMPVVPFTAPQVRPLIQALGLVEEWIRTDSLGEQYPTPPTALQILAQAQHDEEQAKRRRRRQRLAEQSQETWTGSSKTNLSDKSQSAPVPSFLQDARLQCLYFWQNHHSDSATLPFRWLPPVVQLLCHKLLYVCPRGGAFLWLACEATRQWNPNHREEEGDDAYKYKSHWAYHVLIRAVVLGQRIKPHRRAEIPYHVPVWNLLWNVEQRYGPTTTTTKLENEPADDGKRIVHGEEEEEEEAASQSQPTDLDKTRAAAAEKEEECTEKLGRGSPSHLSVDQFLLQLLQQCITPQEDGNNGNHDDHHREPNDDKDDPYEGANSGTQNAGTITTKTSTTALLDNQKTVVFSLPHPLCFPRAMAARAPPLYIIGDSHVLSIAWQQIHLCQGQIRRTLVPLVVTGLKAWHVRPETRFFTTHSWHVTLQRWAASAVAGSTLLVSAGEIDCREGIGGAALQGYTTLCSDQVFHTVQEFVRALRYWTRQWGVQWLVLPVAPHAYRSPKNGKALGRAQRQGRVQLWNALLQQELAQESQIFFLNYTSGLVAPNDDSFVLYPPYNADDTHMNSAFLPKLEHAVEHCGCNVRLL